MANELDWQPIDTAPETGEQFLTFLPYDNGEFAIDTAEYDSELGDFTQFGCGFDYVTHWAPMPARPK